MPSVTDLSATLQRGAWAAIACLALTACSGGPGMRRGDGPPLPAQADPTAAVAADIAFAQMSEREGFVKAVRKSAADDAIALTPAPVPVKDWLKHQDGTGMDAHWRPHRVISSCDGTMAATFGSGQWGGVTANYVTVWERRQARKRKDKVPPYKWVLDASDPVDIAEKKPEFVSTEVADCAPPPADAGPAPGTQRRASDDGTLRFDLTDTANGRPGLLTVSWWDGSTFREAYRHAIVPRTAE